MSDQAANKPARNKPVTIAPSGFTPLESAAPRAAAVKKPRRTMLFLSLALFALLLLFLFSARSLQVLVSAQVPAEVAVSGLALPFGKRYLLLPGEYEVSAKAEGYQPLATTASVDDRDSQTLELSLQALPGRVSIDSTPQGASVTVDGESVGPSASRISRHFSVS